MLILKIFLVFLAVIFIIALLALIILDDLRLFILFKINPLYTRNKCIHKLIKNGEELYYLGTVHDFHITSKEYSLLHIKAVIENLVPDLLLIESRPEELAVGNIADGPVEMLYSHLTARSHGITVKGVDWWSWHENKLTRTYKKRDDTISNNIVTNASGHKKVLVITGMGHMTGGISRLKKQGYVKSNLSKQEKAKIFMHTDTEVIYPKDTEQYIGIRIEREKSLLNGSIKNEKKIECIKRRIKYLERFKSALQETNVI